MPRRLVAMVERRMDLHTDQPFALASGARSGTLTLSALSPDTSKDEPINLIHG
jgi:hypothetical protein